MLRVTSGLCALMVLLLSGCQTSENSNAEPFSLATLAVEKYYVAPDCQGENCSAVTVSALEFPQSPELTEQLQARLLTLAMGITEESALPAESWDGYAQNFFDLATEDSQVRPDFMASEALLKADVYAHHNDLLVLELNSYVYHAGQAHGLPMTEFMVIDERQQRVVTGDDMLLGGQQEAFQAVLGQAHQRWMAEMEQDEQFAATWPLSDSRNIAPLETGWEVKYNVYDIAPYAVGQPSLTITTDELEGIAKPRYLGH
ncbi:RsiV family protein [Vreelandella olivaria]|uniref:RsiV family protein n=1 Tax=Vreelandella olivaria TaxID=390919 RepID=UPI00201F3F03|nr:RsiV family protein [Halomonas olivaria]